MISAFLVSTQLPYLQKPFSQETDIFNEKISYNLDYKNNVITDKICLGGLFHLNFNLIILNLSDSKGKI